MLRSKPLRKSSSEGLPLRGRRLRYSHSPFWPLASPSWRPDKVTAANTGIPSDTSGASSGSRSTRCQTQDTTTQAPPEALLHAGISPSYAETG